MRGRKPVPAATRLAIGNRSHRPIRETATASALPAVPDPPPHLGDEARAIWEKVARELHCARMLTMLDLGALERYCELMARVDRARVHLQAEGEVLVNKSGTYYRNPWLLTLEAAEKEARQVENLLGLNPQSRLHIPKAPAPPDTRPARERFASRAKVAP